MPRPTPARVSCMSALTICLAGACLDAPAQTPPTQWYGYRQPSEDYSYQLVSPTSDTTVYPINLNNHWGLMNRRGDLIVPPVFDWTDYPYDTSHVRAMLDGRTGFINLLGRWHIPPEFTWVDRFSNGFAIFEHQGRYGYIDPRGQVAYEPTLQGALRFEDGLAAAAVDGKVGYLDKRMQWVVPPTFAVGRSFRDGLAAVRTPDDADGPGRWMLLDKRGKPVWTDTAGEVSELGSYRDGYLRFRTAGDNGHWGFFDKARRVVIEPRFADARDFHEGIAAVAVADETTGRLQWGLITKNGQWSAPPAYDALDDFQESQVMFQQDGKYGFIDRIARTGIPAHYEYAEPFFQGYARVALDDGFTYLGRTARDALSPKRYPGRIRDERTKADLRRLNPDEWNRPSTYRVPDFRPQPPIPYEPEHLYDDRLPRR